MITQKTTEEIALLREGGKRLAYIVRHAAAMVRPGLRTGEIEHAVRKMISDRGDTPAFLGYTPDSADRPYPGAICISVNDEIVHGIAGDYIVRDGDIISLDCGLVHCGLITDHAVTVPVGAVADEIALLIETTRRALEVGIAAARPGGHIGDISAAIQKVLEERGYGIVQELAGHGVGYRVHEEPFVPNYGKAGSGPELKVGMVLALEPMATLGSPAIVTDIADGYTVRTADGSLSAHFEHTIAITKDGAEILTKE